MTEYLRIGKWCQCCGEFKYPDLPKGVCEDQLFGVRFQSLVGYMKGNLGSSYSELQSFSKDVLGISVSTGLLAKLVSKCSEALKVPYEELESRLSGSKSLNVDETGWKDQGQRYWVWIFYNSIFAYFTISKSRGSKVLREVLSGALTSDFYSAYVCYSTELQQFCLAHLIRDIKFLTTLPDVASKDFGEAILKYFKIIYSATLNFSKEKTQQKSSGF